MHKRLEELIGACFGNRENIEMVKSTWNTAIDAVIEDISKDNLETIESKDIVVDLQNLKI